jgi:mitogen-activated protein kinase 1/3
MNLVSTQIHDEMFMIPQRYVIAGGIGRGSNGCVVSCTDQFTNERVAVKKIRDAFPAKIEADSTMVERMCALRVLRELKILIHLVDCPNVVRLQGIVVPENYEEFKDVYIITDIMPIDLRSFLQSGALLSDDHVRYLLYQMLTALHHIHSTGIIHRDLKPEVCCAVLCNNVECFVEFCL